ncbi:divalent-cation tolerance protein CutA [Alteraurantiacibacter aquimixticola]|uniref:Divalent-cation tolerance protein CutA n=1 Tax=Alteraurantiacibacter aquimixticola TaxID=2489173 RepID=A0A4T3EXC5_9SPHN|nr:divalent-cation tolerance protein CutA [Alteraurantiacibacter aquimixticola]TIX49118.1 divalent-cation tolerance protein CutA [Alteraurantiacibacter aquimixticola]
MSKAALAWCPFPNEAEARAVATHLLDEKLIACANILPGMVSLYEWEGERGESNEVGVLFKTSAQLRDSLAKRLTQLHSYASPAIMLWDVEAAPETTAEWLGGL